jgi:hypothetical protein
MEMSEVKIITHKDDKINRLEELCDYQEKELQFLRGVIDDFITAFIRELGDVCYCKNCNVSLIDRRFYACEFYDEEKPRPALLCIMSKFEDNSMLIHRGRSNHILPVLRKINDAFESGNGVCLRDILEDYAPDIIETMKQLEGEKK